MSGYFTFTRRYSFFSPSYTYGVDTVTHNGSVGEVARNENHPRHWWASNRTWSGGGDLARVFSTRYAAASALDWIAGGGDPADVGGYAVPAPAHVNYPHEDGRLFDCPACEASCHCDADSGTTACVFSGVHNFGKSDAS